MASCETATGDQSVVAELFWQRAKSKNGDNYAMGEARHTRRAEGEVVRAGRGTRGVEIKAGCSGA